MSVSSNDRRYGITNITGAGQTLSADFRIQADSDVLVWFYDASAASARGVLDTANWSALTLTTHYTISSKTDNGFSVVLGGAVGASGDKALVLDKRVFKTYTSFTGGDSLPPETLQKLAIDCLVEDVQKVSEILGRCVQVPPHSTAKTTPDQTSVGTQIPDLPTDATSTQFVGYDPDSGELVWNGASDLSAVTVSTFAETVLDDLTAEAMRATLGLVLGTDIYSKSALDTLLAAKLALAGGTMTGDLVLAGNPDAALKAAPKQYVDAAAGTRSASGTNSSATKGAGDTTLITQSIAAGALGTTGTVRITVKGSFSAIASTPDIDLKLKFGSTTIGTVTFASATAGSFFIKAEISNNASASAQLGFIDFWHNASGTLTHRLAFGSATENSAGALNAIISADITGSGGDELTCTVDHYMVEVLP